MEQAIIEQPKKSSTPKFVKELLNKNPFDPFMAWSRDKMKELGILDIFDEAWYWVLGWNNFRNIFKFFWGYKVTGRENFPEYGPAVVISNHQSELDPFLVGTAVQRLVRWVSKVENFDIPIFKSIITPFGTIPLRRGESDTEAKEKIRALLDEGECVGMFPEGTRSASGTLAPFHSGAAMFCLESGAPFVPFCITGAYEVLPKNVNWTKTRIFGKHKISVMVGKPVHIDPSIPITKDNLKMIANEMRKDVRLLQLGQMNKARVIRLADLKATPIEIEENMLEAVPSAEEIPGHVSDFNPAEDYSLG